MSPLPNGKKIISLDLTYNFFLNLPKQSKLYKKKLVAEGVSLHSQVLPLHYFLQIAYRFLLHYLKIAGFIQCFSILIEQKVTHIVEIN